MPEFRWILLGLGIVLLAGIWWWGARRSRQAPGDAQLRESIVAPMMPPFHVPTTHTDTASATVSTDWGVPPFEPLSIRTADFDDVPHIDLSMTAHSEPFDDTLDLSSVESLPPAPPQAPAPFPAAAPARAPATAPMTAIARAPVSAAARAPAPAAARASAPVMAARTPPPAAAPALEYSDRFNNVESEEPNTSEKQRIVSIRVCAVEDPWRGADLLAVLGDLGLAHGRYQVFHRKHSDGRTLFCAASLVEPGTFDLARMPEEEFRGLTLFAVLPGPAEPLQTIDALIATAEDLAEALQGTVQITKGVPLSAQGVATLREDVARFQASMTG